jgi:signal peptidase I
MKWWRDWQTLKQARELVKGSRKLLRIQRDRLEARQVQDVSTAADNLAAAVKAKNISAAESCAEKLHHQLEKAFPRQPLAGLRENIEVLLVAAIVVMGVRTFFIQPFKIPTGSMQPTLYGIVQWPGGCTRESSLVTRLRDGAVKGVWPQRPNGSILQALTDYVGWSLFAHWPPGGFCLFSGDHIFVDRFTYHFRKPQRGDVIVFDTSNIRRIPEASRGKFYIKRLIGLGGDTIQIAPPHVVVNNRVLDDRPAFKRIYSMQDGYSGYVLPSGFPPSSIRALDEMVIRNPDDIYMVPDQDLFVLGDNSPSSLDGRFWGSLNKRALVGRAVMVYWPFTDRFGRIN